MDIEKFEDLIRKRAEDSLDLKLGDKSWQDFKHVHLKSKKRSPFILNLLLFFFIAAFSFLTGIFFANYQHKAYADKTETLSPSMDDAGILADNFISPNESKAIQNKANKNTNGVIKFDSNHNQREIEANHNNNEKATHSGKKNIFNKKNKTFDDHNYHFNAENVRPDAEMLEKRNQIDNLIANNPQQTFDSSKDKIELNKAETGISEVLSPLSKSIAELQYSNTVILKHGIEPAKEKYIYQNYIYAGGLAFIKEHEQNYVGWRVGYYHEVKKNFRLFGSVYKVNDKVELGTQIIPEHFPAPQPGLEIEHILINKSTYVLPFGINYTYPKFKIKPFVSLGFAPEYAKINKVKYQYKNSSDNIPDETKIVNIKTSNFYLYTDFGLQGPVYNKFDWKISMHLLNYLSGHEDGAENEDNFKSYLNAGLIFKL